MKFKKIIDDLNGNTRRRAKTRVAVGTSIGVLVGAAAGILLAPKSGKEVRKDIKNKAKWSADKVREAARKAAIFAKEEANLVNETFSEKVDDLKARLKREKEVPIDWAEKPEEENKTYK